MAISKLLATIPDESPRGRRRGRHGIEWMHKIDVEDFLQTFEVENMTRSAGDEIQFSCPFPGHSGGDSSPSAYMNTGERERSKTTAWMCHGCGRAGNAITFYAEIENVTKQEAARHIREHYAPDWRAPKGGIVQELEERLHEYREARMPVSHEFTEISIEDYYEMFGIDWPLGSRASDFRGNPMGYMLGRGFRPETLNAWDIGYDEIGDRITIPVFDLDNRLVGIKGRAIRKGRKPKYLILGDKEGVAPRYGFAPYEKSLLVFGFHMWPEHTGTFVFCEGELDVIALWQIGVPAICTGSAALSHEQALIIRQRCDEVVLFLDNDTAGSHAVRGYFSKGGEWHPGIIEKLEPFIGVRLVREHADDPAGMIESGKVLALRTMIRTATSSRRLVQVQGSDAMIPL